MRTLTLFVAVGLVVFGCYKKEHKSVDQISGTYVREHSFNVTNPETDTEVGVRTVRDTIHIKRLADKFEVSNHKWAKNDYDDNGWRNSAHMDDRPFPTFLADLEPGNNSLRSRVDASVKVTLNETRMEVQFATNIYRRE